MNDFIKLAISEIPKYALHFIMVVIHPHEAVKQLVESDNDYFAKAWTFFAISLLLTELIVNVQPARADNFALALVADAVWSGIPVPFAREA